MEGITHLKDQPEKKDFLISYTEFQRQWAIWIAWYLEKEGYSTVLPDWDFLPGLNKVYELHRATEQAEHIIAVFSPQYVNTLYIHPEWAAAFGEGSTDKDRRFIP